MTNSRITLNLLALALSASVLGACSFHLPRVHKVPVQQGNLVTQEMVDRLKPGMTQSQVAFVMGEPVLRNTFNANRWDYLYRVEIGGRFQQMKSISLFFDNQRLLYFTGDYKPSGNQDSEEPASF